MRAMQGKKKDSHISPLLHRQMSSVLTGFLWLGAFWLEGQADGFLEGLVAYQTSVSRDAWPLGSNLPPMNETLNSQSKGKLFQTNLIKGWLKYVKSL